MCVHLTAGLRSIPLRPECRINLAHTVAYLSEAPKSTRAYEAYKRVRAVALYLSSLRYR